MYLLFLWHLHAYLICYIFTGHDKKSLKKEIEHTHLNHLKRVGTVCHSILLDFPRHDTNMII